VEELIASSQEYDSLAPDMEVGDLVDQAFRTYEVNLLFDIGASEKRRLHEIDSALDRVRNGSYGMCSACRKPIAAKRLNAMPWAELCVKCKEEEEKKPVAPSEGPEE
jgi:RNA polymerase-binding protein DksA